MNSGQLILLNGTSSAGKTSIATVLQSKIEGLVIQYGLDRLLSMLPDHYFKQPLWNEIMGKSVQSGPLGDQLIFLMYSNIKEFLDAGFTVVADHVLIEKSWVDMAAKTFCESQAYLIGVRCNIDVLAEREINRKNRTLGSARLQYDFVHRWTKYDFEVDTSTQSSESAALKILNYLNSGAVPAAFRNLSLVAGR